MWGLLWRWCCKIEIPNKLFRRQFLNNLFKNLLKMHRHKPEYCNSDRFKDMLNSFRYQLQLRGKPSYKNITLTIFNSLFGLDHSDGLGIFTNPTNTYISVLFHSANIFPQRTQNEMLWVYNKKNAHKSLNLVIFTDQKITNMTVTENIHLRWLPSMKASWPPGGRL